MVAIHISMVTDTNFPSILNSSAAILAVLYIIYSNMSITLEIGQVAAFFDKNFISL
ncbi:MAG: hypothetical protein JWO73_120 [Candidatus Taylorbacteria bacterium]|nr:hypothetical protein [Candidatus Taylorbacteria bacterium]